MAKVDHAMVCVLYARGEKLKDIARQAGCTVQNVSHILSTNRVPRDRASSKKPGAGRLRRIWIGMTKRCSDSRRKDFKWYGGRGVCVCPEWGSFSSFLSWSEENGYRDGLTLDRIDGAGNYSPGNCRWVTHQENCQNRKAVKMTPAMVKAARIAFAMGMSNQSQIARFFGIERSIIRNVVNRKTWSNLII